MKPKLERLARLKKVSSNVRFLGHVTRCELPLYYSACDVLPYVYSLQKQTYDSVPIEAIMCNTPVIVADRCENSELVNKGIGIKVPLRDLKSLKNAVEKIIDGEFAMNQSERQTIIENYSEDALASNLRDIINNG